MTECETKPSFKMNSSGSTNQTKSKTNQNIQVYVRVRPLNSRERSIRSCEVVDVVTPKEVVVRQLFDSKTTKKFTFDRSFGPESRQSEVYQSVVAPLIEEVLAGYNCTVFAYGQTGTGKTHTMIGTENPELKSSWEDESMVGIIPRALSHLFDELRMMELEFSMRISYLELYNEELCDLLSSDDSTKIRIFDDATKKGSIIVQGLEEIPVHSKDDVYKLLEKGKERRKTAATLMNAQSSRSHTVFSILVHIRENGIDGEEMLKIGKLNLVDLAGSENISKAGNEKGIRTRETVNINQSLLTLGRVITALVERTPHIPYRESKLTRLLQESLGGRTKTSIIATISPGHKDLEETLSTLEYAHRAKNIQNRPEINQKLTKKTVLKEYTEEIDRLKRDLMAARDKNGIYLAEETYNDMQYKLDSQNKELNEKMLLVKALKDELASKERIFNEVSLHLIEKSEQLMKTENILTNTKSELTQTKTVLTKTKRRVEEKKQIVESHLKTEKVLTEQATKLIEVAEVATTDTHELHNTIERRKNAEINNQTACEAFVERMENLFDEMKQQLNMLTKEHKSHSQLIAEEIGENSKAYKQFSTSATNKIKSISKQCIESLTEVQSSREKYSEQFIDANSKHKIACNAEMDELREREHDFKSNLENYFAEILEIVNQINTAATSGREKLVERITSYSGSVSDLVSRTCTGFEAFAESTRSSLEQEFSALQIDKTERENLAIKRQAALSNYLKEIHEIEEEEVSRRKQVGEITQRMQTLVGRVPIEVESRVRIIQTIGEESQKYCEILEDIVSQAETETHAIAKRCSDETEDVKKIVVNNANDKAAKYDKMKSVVDSHACEFVDVLENFKKESLTLEEKLSKEVGSECDNSTDLISKETERVMKCHLQFRALNQSLQSSVNDYSSQNNCTMSDCKKSLRTFKEEEIKPYTPTGQTPSRKDFSYPRILAATSPHANIIRRYRMEKEWSDADTTATITEDSESLLHDVSSDELGINSTPIRSDIESDDSKLKDIQSEFNCHISKIHNLEHKPLSRKNTPALLYATENKENCIT